MLISIVSHRMSLYLVSFLSVLSGWVVQEKIFRLNLYRAKYGVISFRVGGPKKKVLGVNLCQAKSGAISFY